MKFTFKKEPKMTGLASIGHNPGTFIKYGGRVVGFISAPQWSSKDNLCRIRFSVLKSDLNEDGNPNCKWKWIQLKATFESDGEARDFLKKLDADEFVNIKRVVCTDDY